MFQDVLDLGFQEKHLATLWFFPSSPQAPTSFQSPPGPPRSTGSVLSGLSHQIRRYDDDILRELPEREEVTLRNGHPQTLAASPSRSLNENGARSLIGRER
jgi:hypothetical protein